MFLKKQIQNSNFIFHLAGTNRSKKKKEYEDNNVNLTSNICKFILDTKKKIPIFFSSTTQINNKNSYYSKTKLQGENIIKFYLKKKTQITIARIPNVYGKWSKPNYNSFISTCCHNIPRNIKINLSGVNNRLDLIYIDDLVSNLLNLINQKLNNNFKYLKLSNVENLTVKEIYTKLSYFEKSRSLGIIENLDNSLTSKLYSTYISFLPKKKISYSIKTHKNKTGSFTEFLKNKNFGQISFISIKPGCTRGNHYHHSKVEKFLIIRGSGVFAFKNIKDNKQIKIKVSGRDLKVVQTIPGFAHSIKNIGKQELISIIWSNQIFDKKKPDTIYQFIK